jgi:leucyl-tRNA synthetase
LLVETTITLPVQVNGKKRADVTVARDAKNAEIEAAVLALEAIPARAQRQAAQEGDRGAAADRERGGVRVGHAAATISASSSAKADDPVIT